MSGQTFPAGPTPPEELRKIAATFPGRDRRGYVVGYYLTAGARGGRIAGPFPSILDADRHAAGSPLVRAAAWPFAPTIVCALVFTSRGTVVGPDTPAAADILTGVA